MKRCNTCGGTYDEFGADGVRYFHVCPPLSVHEIAAALDAGTLTIDLEAERVRHGLRRQQLDEAPPAYRARLLNELVAVRTFPRPHTRNENVTGKRTKKGDAILISEGKGARDITDDELHRERVAADAVR